MTVPTAITFCAKHPSGRSGKRFLTPFSCHVRLLRFTFIALLMAGLGTAAFADEMPRVDAARFGFSPSAAASKNVAALQTALNGGHKTVSVTAPGIYDLDATVYLDSHTCLACGKGVTLRKAAP
jgi:hypothetical protein